MKIIKANIDMLNDINSIYTIAQKHMVNEGNILQWNKPFECFKADICKYIDNSQLFVVVDNKEIVGFFAIVDGIDETYKNIMDGNWLNEEKYVTIHKMAVKYFQKNIGSFIIDYVIKYCKEKSVFNIRIDTHNNNLSMKHLLNKHNFIRCGIISINNNFDDLSSLREAYIKQIK